MGALTQHKAEVEKQQAATPGALLASRQQEMTDVMPAHVPHQAWMRQAVAAVNTGKIINTPNGPRYQLAVAAMNNPEAFFSACRRAASLGLVPGTEQFYLTPRRVNGQEEILGIIGYQGYIELIYNRGLVASVVVETVHSNDGFEFVRGRDEYPIHTIDWRGERKGDDGKPLGRGELQLVYAYAKFINGATSLVVVLTEEDIARAKAKSAGSDYPSSPWNTDTKAMWLKTAVRRLQKWVPWSVERVQAVSASHDLPGAEVGASPPAGAVAKPSLPYDGHAQLQSAPGDVVEAEAVLDEGEEIAEGEVQDVSSLPEVPVAQSTVDAVERANPNQLRRLATAFNEVGIKGADRAEYVKAKLGIEGAFTPNEMTPEQAEEVIANLKAKAEQQAADPPVDPEQEAVSQLAEEAERESAS